MKYIKLFENYSEPVPISRDDFYQLNDEVYHNEPFTSNEIKWLKDNFTYYKFCSVMPWFASGEFGNSSDEPIWFSSIKDSSLRYSQGLSIWKMEDEWFYVSIKSVEFYKCDGFEGLKLLLKKYIDK